MKPTAGKKLSAAEAGTMHFAAYGPEDCIRRSAAGASLSVAGQGHGSRSGGAGQGDCRETAPPRFPAGHARMRNNSYI